MSRVRLVTTLLLAALLTVADVHAATPPGATAAWLLEQIKTLTATDMNGRGSGTPGADRAARHIADVLRDAGLQAVTQAFPLGARLHALPASRLLLSDGRSPELGNDWTPLAASAEGVAAGPIVFVGYGISAPELGYDDYAGVDVRDRLVLAISGEPRRGDPSSPFTRAGASPHGFPLRKATVAAARGARALLLVSRPSSSPQALPRLAGTPGTAQILVAAVSAALADELLAGAGGESQRLDPTARRIDTTLMPASRVLPAAVSRVEVRIGLEPAAAENVIALLGGTDPSRANEAVVVGAHYDHLGRPDDVYPGADDNASGTAAVLALARHFSASGGTPRTLVFALFAGEELGLLGSEAYVQHPSVPLVRTVAMVNLDMVGRMRDDRVHVAGVDSATALREVVDTAGRGLGLDLRVRGTPYGPSDHQSFYRQGVPVLFFSTGAHSDYHRPSDTWEKINAAGLERVVALVGRVVEGLARHPAPAYVRVAPTRPARGESSGGFLGVSPEMGDDSPGVRLSRVVRDSPAERAGLRAGDVIVRFGGVRVYAFEELRGLLASRASGDRVEVAYVRDDAERAVDATLEGRP